MKNDLAALDMNTKFNRWPPHDRAVSRSPLGPPSAKAKRFLIERDPYPAEAYVQPDERLAKAAALFEEQRKARALREEM